MPVIEPNPPQPPRRQTLRIVHRDSTFSTIVEVDGEIVGELQDGMRVPMTNPFLPDVTGNFQFYVVGDGEYDIQIEDVSLRKKISEAYSGTVLVGR